MLKKYDSRPNPILPMLINKLKAKQVYNNTVFFIISDHGQTDINGDDAHSIVLDKIKEVVEDSKYGDIYDFYLPDEEEEYDSVAVFNSGMLGIYLKQRTREGDPTKWRDGSIPVWPRFEEDVFHVVKWINKHRTAGDEDQFYKAGEDAVEEILVALRPGRDAEPLYRIVKNNMDFPDCMGPVGPEGLFHCGIWHIQEAHPDYVDAVRRIENYGHPTRSADIIILPKYKKGFHFSSEDNKSEHGSLYPEDSHITFVIAGLPIGRGDPNGRNTQVSSLQSIVDIAPTITYLLGLGGSFDGKSVLKPGCFEGRNSPFMAIDEPSNWYNPNPFGPPKCSFDMTPFMKIVPFIEEPHLFNKIP
jgi:arylsulfatase A-like enzyme